MEKKSMPKVVIVGAGFAGLQAARTLAGAPVQVTLMDQHNYHLFQPLLYQVATAGVAPEDIAYPVRAILKNQKNLDFRMAEMKGVDLNSRCVGTSAGCIPYDYLILAVGGETNYYGLDGVAQFGFGLKNIDDAIGLRNHILRMFELAAQEPDADLRRSMLTFVVAGGGATGVESAGALSELIRLVLMKEFLSLAVKETRIVLLEGSDRLLAMMPEKLREETAKTLWKKHVEVRFGASVADYDGKRVTLKGGEIIPSGTLIWAAGIQAATVLKGIGVELKRQGRVQVLPTLQVPERPEVFVIGDAAYLEQEGVPLPTIAPVAVQEAETAARNILRLHRKEELQPFVYKDPGILATIGRNQGVACMGTWQFSGAIAWFLWLVVHIIRLIGFRNRLLVLINWAWDYWFYERAVRLIMPECLTRRHLWDKDGNTGG